MSDTVTAINLLVEFLANQQTEHLQTCPPLDCIVICASAILHQAEVLFRTLELRPTMTKTVVLVGGIGHSTQLIYDAVARHERYSQVFSEVDGLAEARVLEVILHTFFDYAKITSQGCQILIEDKSANCGSNAVETIKLLRASRNPDPRACIIIQDPTMSLRTLASFRKLYLHQPLPPTFSCCPIFVPRVVASGSEWVYDTTKGPDSGLWTKDRFLSLIIGEIPRLRDDEHGYGPNGKDFIAHVDVPSAVESAWAHLAEVCRMSTR